MWLTKKAKPIFQIKNKIPFSWIIWFPFQILFEINILLCIYFYLFNLKTQIIVESNLLRFLTWIELRALLRALTEYNEKHKQFFIVLQNKCSGRWRDIQGSISNKPCYSTISIYATALFSRIHLEKRFSEEDLKSRTSFKITWFVKVPVSLVLKSFWR